MAIKIGHFTLNAITVIFICLFASILWVTHDKRHQIKEVQKIEKQEQFDSVKYYRDCYHSEHAQKRQLQTNLEAIIAIHGNYVDSVTKRDKIKTKQIQEATHIDASVHGGGEAKIVHDTIPVYVNNHPTVEVVDSFHYKDSVMAINGQVDKNQVGLNYSATIPIDFDVYWKRPHSFLGIKYGKPVHYIDGYSTAANVHITGLESVYIKPKMPSRLKWFLIGAGTILLLHR